MLSLTACTVAEQKPEPVKPFQFRSLTLRQNDRKGQPLWQLRSPRAGYQLNSRMASVDRPSGLLYRQGVPSYRITAPNGIVIRDGERVELLNGVTLVSLDKRKLVIRGKKAIWIPRNDTIDLEGSPQAEDGQQLITAGRARFFTSKDLLQLREKPQLFQWPRNVSHRLPARLELVTTSADWNTANGDLRAAGPVRSIERPGKGKQQRLLTASAMEGNTQAEWLDFLAPVHLVDPGQQSVIDAGRSRWWYNQERITSIEPAKASLRKIKVSGRELTLVQASNQVLVGADCVLEQPDQWLQAQRCEWNWNSGVLNAHGDVVLHRNNPEQITRAAEMRGMIGKDGSVQFSSPGNQVRTQLRFKRGQDPAGGDQGAAARSPVQF
jgi:LPS export ABC transporter protein LptC